MPKHSIQFVSIHILSHMTVTKAIDPQRKRVGRELRHVEESQLSEHKNQDDCRYNRWISGILVNGRRWPRRDNCPLFWHLNSALSTSIATANPCRRSRVFFLQSCFGPPTTETFVSALWLVAVSSDISRSSIAVKTGTDQISLEKCLLDEAGDCQVNSPSLSSGDERNAALRLAKSTRKYSSVIHFFHAVYRRNGADRRAGHSSDSPRTRFSHCQYTPRKRVDRPKIQWSHQASNSKLHSTSWPIIFT
jgi:hypothetical protein